MLAGIRQLVVKMKAIEKDEMVGESQRGVQRPCQTPPHALPSSSLLLSSLELSDTKVYEPSIRALFGNTAHFHALPRPDSDSNKLLADTHNRQLN